MKVGDIVSVKDIPGVGQPAGDGHRYVWYDIPWPGAEGTPHAYSRLRGGSGLGFLGENLVSVVEPTAHQPVGTFPFLNPGTGRV